MREKRLISLLLCLCMTATSTLPALAVEDVSADVVDEMGIFGSETDEDFSDNFIDIVPEEIINETTENISDSYETEEDFTSSSETNADFLVPVEPVTEVPDGYIGIYTAEDLYNVRNNSSANYILMNDIDLSVYENWEPIPSYSGIFDGNGYTIENMSISSVKSDNSVGLFGYIWDGFVKNILLCNAKIIYDTAFEGYNIGGIAGSIVASQIDNCVVTGLIDYSDETKSNSVLFVGGITGSATRTNLTNCLNLTQINIVVDRGLCVGGIAGEYDGLNGDFILYNLINNANITIIGSKTYSNDVGGIFGHMEFQNGKSMVMGLKNQACIRSINFSSSYSTTGGVTGSMAVYNDASLIFKDSSNTEVVESDNSNIGGIIGEFMNPGGIGYDYGSNSSVVDISNIFNSGIIITNNTLGTFRIGGLAGYIQCDPVTMYGTDNVLSVVVRFKNSYNSGLVKVNDSYTGDAVGFLSGIIGATSVVNSDNSCNSLMLSECYNIGILQLNMSDSARSFYASELYCPAGVDNVISDNLYYHPQNVANYHNINSISLSLLEMQQQSSFVGFDFDTVWEIGVTDGYPYPTLRDNPHNGDIVLPTPDLQITTDFDTSDLTLAVGESYIVSGNITTTAETGLNNIQINLNSATEQGVGIILDRKENVGILNYNLADSAIILTAGETYTGLDQGGNEQTITLEPGTSLYVQIYATDNDGNSLGDGVKKKINIVESPAQAFVGRVYTQSTRTEGITELPYIKFDSITQGVFHIVYPEDYVDVPFIYSVVDDNIVLNNIPGLSDFYFSELVFNIIDNNTIEFVSFKSEYGIFGWTRVGDRFEAEVTQVKPTVTGLQESYTVTQGEDLEISFKVTAGDGGKLEKVTIMHNEAGTSFNPYTFDNINEASLTVENMFINTEVYPFNTVGTHEFVIYASADNYKLTDNAVGKFTVGVECAHEYKDMHYVEDIEFVSIDSNSHIHKYYEYHKNVCVICDNNYVVSKIYREKIECCSKSDGIMLENGGYLCKCGVIYANDSFEQWTTKLKLGVGNQKVYTTPELSIEKGIVYSNDMIYVLASVGNCFYIQYPIDKGGYKHGFILKSYLLSKEDAKDISASLGIKTPNQNLVNYFIYTKNFYDTNTGIQGQPFIKDYSTAKQIAASLETDGLESIIQNLKWYTTASFTDKISMFLNVNENIPLIGDIYYSGKTKEFIKSIIENIPQEKGVTSIVFEAICDNKELTTKLQKYVNNLKSSINVLDSTFYTDLQQKDLEKIDEIIWESITDKEWKESYKNALDTLHLNEILYSIPQKYKNFVKDDMIDKLVDVISEYINIQKIITASNVGYYSVLISLFENDSSAVKLIQEYRDMYINENLIVPYLLIYTFESALKEVTGDLIKDIAKKGMVNATLFVAEKLGIDIGVNISVKSVTATIFLMDILNKVSGLTERSESEQKLVYYYYLNDTIKYSLVREVKKYIDGNDTAEQANEIVALYNVWRGLQITLNKIAYSATDNYMKKNILDAENSHLESNDMFYYSLSPYFVSNNIKKPDYSDILNSQYGDYFKILLDGWNISATDEIINGKDGIMTYWNDMSQYERSLIVDELEDMREFITQSSKGYTIYILNIYKTKTYKLYQHFSEKENAVLITTGNGKCGLLIRNQYTSTNVYTKSFNFIDEKLIRKILEINGKPDPDYDTFPGIMYVPGETTKLIIEGYFNNETNIEYTSFILNGNNRSSYEFCSSYWKFAIDGEDLSNLFDIFLSRKSYRYERFPLASNIRKFFKQNYNINIPSISGYNSEYIDTQAFDKLIVQNSFGNVRTTTYHGKLYNAKFDLYIHCTPFNVKF